MRAKYCATCNQFKTCKLDERKSGIGCRSFEPEEDVETIQRNLTAWLPTQRKTIFKERIRTKTLFLPNTWGILPWKFPRRIHHDFSRLNLTNKTEISHFIKRYDRYFSGLTITKKSISDRRLIERLIQEYHDAQNPRAVESINKQLSCIHPTLQVRYLKATDDIKKKDKVIVAGLERGRSLLELCVLALALEIIDETHTDPCIMCSKPYIRRHHDQFTCSSRCSKEQNDEVRRWKREKNREKTLLKNSPYDVHSPQNA